MIHIKRFFNRIYALAILLVFTIGLSLYYQYQFYESTIHKELESSIGLKMEYMNSLIEKYFDQSVEALESIEILLQTEDDDNKILYFLEKKLETTPTYMSLYFGDPQNHMINGSGWIPPETFDLRTRPWYIKATEEDKLITTALYLNASEDYWIVTFAKPVYSRSGEFLGVIGGDNSLESIVSVLKEQTISRNGFAFFLDADNKIIMHSDFEDSESDRESVEFVTRPLKKLVTSTSQGVHYVKLDGQQGYLGWNKIEQTGWVIGNFVPISDYIDAEKQQGMILWITFVMAVLSVLVLFIIQRRFIIKPLVVLDRDIERISLDRDISYRLPSDHADPFLPIRHRINETLDRTHDLFHDMKESKKALEVSEMKNRAIIEVLPDLIFLYSDKGIFLDCLENKHDELYLEKEAFIGKSLHDVMPKEVADKGLESIKRTLETGEMQHFEYSLQMSGRVQYFETRFMMVTHEEVLAVVRNITENKEHLERIEHLSFHDQLTGLYNRRFYEEELQRLDTARNLPLSLVMLDVNGLKLTNDAFGHLAGDELLKSVAGALRNQCRTDDIIARIGGDEFILLLPETAHDEAGRIVERIQAEIKSLSVSNVPVSVSIGCQTKNDTIEPIMEVFVKAEDQMYRKKLTESQSMRNKTIQVILETLNAKNEREKIHSENVSMISRNIGEALELSYQTLKEIEIAGLMHDIGKIAISEAVLNKKGPLTESQYVEVKKHPESGYQILKSVDAYSSLAEYALSHHEKYDGTGYPKGLKGNEIPLISRIISVADAYEAMISDRAYRQAISHEEAIEELKRCAGSQFDPKIVQAIVKLYAKYDDE